MVTPSLANPYAGKSKENKGTATQEHLVLVSNRTKGEGATSATKTRTTTKKKKKYQIAVNLSNCKYDVVREVIRKKGWVEVDEEADWQLCWTDTSVGLERLLKLTKTQKINHFSGMLEICRKKSLCRNIENMSKKCDKEYNFVPRSFMLPEGLDDLLAYVGQKNRKGKKPTTFILKPDNGCQGKGIRLLQTTKDVHNAVEYCENQKAVVQHYIHRPFLINDLKFDLRVYALVTCCDPLRIFLYDEGLVRFCTEKYQAPRQDNLNIACMHLTNYAVNKHNVNFEAEGSSMDSLEGSNWSLRTLKEWMESNGHDWDKIWDDIGDMVVKTVVSIQPILSYFYQSAFPIDNDGLSCFEILGLDVMLDNKCKPWLIEVNHSPSFNTDTELDLDVKEGLISDSINLIQLSASRIKKAKAEDKRACKERLYSSRSYSARKITREEAQKKRREAICSLEKYEGKNKGRFTRLLPAPSCEEKQQKYDRLLEIATQNFKESFHFKIGTTLERFKLAAVEKSAARDAKKAAKNAMTKRKKPPRRPSQISDKTIARLHQDLRNPRSSRGRQVSTQPSNLGPSKKGEAERIAMMLERLPPGLAGHTGAVYGREYLDVVQRTSRQGLDYSASYTGGYASKGHSRSNSFTKKEFPQFRDIIPNALYKDDFNLKYRTDGLGGLGGLKDANGYNSLTNLSISGTNLGTRI